MADTGLPVGHRRFFLPVRVLSPFPPPVPRSLEAAQTAGGLRFFGALEPFGDGDARRWVLCARSAAARLSPNGAPLQTREATAPTADLYNT